MTLWMSAAGRSVHGRTHLGGALQPSSYSEHLVDRTSKAWNVRHGTWVLRLLLRCCSNARLAGRWNGVLLCEFPLSEAYVAALFLSTLEMHSSIWYCFKSFGIALQIEENTSFWTPRRLSSQGTFPGRRQSACGECKVLQERFATPHFAGCMALDLHSCSETGQVVLNIHWKRLQFRLTSLRHI